MDWEHKKILVIGAARSGVTSAKVLSELGAKVTVTDIKREEELRETVLELKALGVKVVMGKYPVLTAQNTDLVIISPGVPFNVPLVEAALELGIPVWSELELAFRLARGTIIAITGTNGKTTTTSLIGHIFQKAGQPVLVAGNIGIPLVGEMDKDTPERTMVVEVSSFQLEGVESFRPRVAILLNLTPDHLDRHETMENYLEIKSRIFARQTSEDYTIINYDDEILRPLAQKSPAQVLLFSCKHNLRTGAFLRDGKIMVNVGSGTETVCDFSELGIRGDHNLENALAAVIAARVMGLSSREIAWGLKEFAGVAHRLEPVGQVAGVNFINDFKGTNPEAVLKAIQSFNAPLILIAGGKNKGSDFRALAKIIQERVKAVVLVGEAAPQIYKALLKEGYAKVTFADDFQKVVSLAFALSEPGDVVLLSPACASWDMFSNYEERGEAFKRQVAALSAAKPVRPGGL